jgi:hypothetical protein
MLAMPSTRVALLLLLVASGGCAETLRTGEAEWQRSDGFSRADRRQILELASAAGLADVRNVYKAWHRPLEHFHAVVESEKTVAGGQVTWREVVVCGAEDRDHCERLASGTTLRQSGAWTTAGVIDKEERRRITDGTWHVDVALGPEVTVDVAERIVLAFRRSTVVNRSKSPDVIVRFDWATIRTEVFPWVSIQRDSKNPGGYVVSMAGDGHGKEVTVRLAGEQVEVHDMSFWEA